MTDDAGRRDGPEPDPGTEQSTGDPIEALFAFDAFGEVEDYEGEDVSEPDPHLASSFTLEPQLGEAMPPELRPPLPGPLDAGPDLPDPTDPGFTADPSEHKSAAPELGAQEPSAFDPDVDLPDPSDPGFTAEDLAAFHDDAGPVTPAELTGDSLWPDIDDLGGPVDDGPPAHPGPPPPPQEIDWDRLAGADYPTSSTTEYEGLAAELAAARHEDTEQIAVSASIPGVDSGLVGLDDVLDATGEEAPVTSHTVAELGLRVATALGLMALFLLSLLWSAGIAVLALIVFGLAAGEFYAVLVRTRHHPLSVFGLLGVAGCLIGAWVWGVVAIPLAVLATIIAVALFYGIAAPREDTLRDASWTVLVAAWVGGFGAFALPIITDNDYGWLIAGVVVIVAATDVGQYFVGRAIGRRPLSPVISPKKTVEGWFGGVVAAFAVAFGFSFLGPFDRMSVFLVAAAAVTLGPIGDLSISMVKRQIGVKDMGTVLPGHGGILDRIDALLFVVPAAWLVFRATGLIT